MEIQSATQRNKPRLKDCGELSRFLEREKLQIQNLDNWYRVSVYHSFIELEARRWFKTTEVCPVFWSVFIQAIIGDTGQVLLLRGAKILMYGARKVLLCGEKSLLNAFWSSFILKELFPKLDQILPPCHLSILFFFDPPPLFFFFFFFFLCVTSHSIKKKKGRQDIRFS